MRKHLKKKKRSCPMCNAQPARVLHLMDANARLRDRVRRLEQELQAEKDAIAAALV